MKCPVLRSIVADSSEATLLRSRRFEMSQRLSSLLSTNEVTAPPFLLATATGMATEWMVMALKPVAASNSITTSAVSCDCLTSPSAACVVTSRSHVSLMASVSAWLTGTATTVHNSNGSVTVSGELGTGRRITGNSSERHDLNLAGAPQDVDADGVCPPLEREID